MAARRKKQYSQETLDVALKMVTSGVLTMYKAARMFGVPQQTLSDKKNRVYKGELPGRPKKLLKTEEEALKEWILLQGGSGCPVNINIIKQKAEEILKARTGESFLGNKWCHRFVKRHPQVLKIWKRLKNKSIEEVSSQNQEASDLSKEVVIKDELGNYETSTVIEFDDLGSSDDGAFLSQSISELKSITNDDSNFNFCMSMFNEMSKMNDEQLMDFRLKTQEVFEEILNKT